MKKSTGRIIIFASLLAVIAMFSFFLKDILIPYIRMEMAQDLDGAKELLVSKGIWGFFTVVLVEALQMVVIFIPAEFIQISSGMSYPFYIAVLLCDLGVCLGATIIYVLVRLFKFSNEAFDKREEEIEKIAVKAKKARSTVLLMYFLFIMPIIPFGAICYYGSRSNIKYGRYIFTVATGVIPSIITSNIMGAATKFFLGNDLPLPLLILIIVLLGAALFLALFIFLDKVYFKENDRTPDSVIYSAFFRIVGFLRKNRQRLHIDSTGVDKLKSPYIILANHSSFYDFYYIHRLFKGVNPAYVVNRHIISLPLIKKLTEKAGFIPKRLFNVDFVTPKGILRAIRGGYPVVIFPEGRLSLTGKNYPIVERSAAFYKKLGTDIVIAKIRGAYFANPKWRSSIYKSDIYVGVDRVITKEEAAELSVDELNELIEKSLGYDESSLGSTTAYNKKERAKGIENVLYRCIECGELYSTKSAGNELVCTNCGRHWHIDEHYFFTEEPRTVDAYYERIKELERKELKGFRLKTKVDAVIFSDKGKRKRSEKGLCVLSEEGFRYIGNGKDFLIDYSLLPALAFSCDKEFELYYENDLYYFYPVENRRQVVRWGLYVDLIRERNDGE